MTAVAIPLILRRVPPNRLYGFRTRKTLHDRQAWFAANFFGGWALLGAAFLGAILTTVGAPPTPALLVPLFASVAVALVYVRRIDS